MKLSELFEAVIKPDENILRDIRTTLEQALPKDYWDPSNFPEGYEDAQLRVLMSDAFLLYMNIDVQASSTPSSNPLMQEVGISSFTYSGISDDLPDITLAINREDFVAALGDKDKYEKFIDVFMMGIEHEMVHYEQDMRGNGSMNPENTSFDSTADYLGNKYEMMAHANDAVKILLSKYTNRKAIQMVSSESVWEEDIFRLYKETFSGTEQEKSVLRRFLKYCYEYLTR